MKKFKVEDEVFNILPDLSIGILVLKDVKEDKKLDEKEAKEEEELLKNSNINSKKYITSEVISENEVVKEWRDTYSKFPTKKGARCSVENLLKRVIHDNPVGNICPSVDITNSISLKYALPIGAEDSDKIEGDLTLGIMNGDEHFIPIGKDSEEPPLKGEIAYKDEYGVVCRCLNWRDGIRTEITDETKNEFIAMECINPNRVEELKNAIDELSELMTKYLDCEIVNKVIINKDNKETDLI